MNRHRLLAATLMLALAGAWVAASSRQVDPEIAGVAPNPASPSPAPQVLTINGHGFLDRVTLSITTPAGAMIHTRDADVMDVRDGSFRASVVLAAAGNYQVVATNADGKSSSPFMLSVKAQTVSPVVTSIKPMELSKSPNAQQLTIEGSKFAPGLSVMLTDPAGTVQTISGNAIGQISPNSFQVSVTVELEGDYSLTVTNPGGAASSAFGFKINR